MQLMFYMTPQDERGFIDYMLSKGCYFTPESWKSYPPPILSEDVPPASGVADDLRELMIFREDLYSKEDAVSDDWKVYWKPGRLFTMATRPGLEYIRPCVDRGQLFPGNLRCDGTACSFLVPGETASTVREEHRQAYKRLQNFYRACCNHLHRSMAPYGPGWHIGHDVEDFCAQRGISRAPSTHPGAGF